MAEGGELHHESRAKWPSSADEYELEETIGKCFFPMKRKFFQFEVKNYQFRSRCYSCSSSSNSQKE